MEWTMISDELKAFIARHADDDVRQLALDARKYADVDVAMAIRQIEGRRRARQKLPWLAAKADIVYPVQLSMEQCSSEQTACYKQQLAKQLPRHRRVVDLTGGFGVDLMWLARHFDEAVYVERNEALCRVARHNFDVLQLTHVRVVCGTAEAQLAAMPSADLLFVDPARRDDRGCRTYGISDCTPDVLQLLPQMLQLSPHVLLKLSPMLDWHKALSDLRRAAQPVSVACDVHIVSVDNECKELLLLLSVQDAAPEHGGAAGRLVCTNLLTSGGEQRFETTLNAAPCTPSFATPSPGLYLYEPNASLMKAGCFDEMGDFYGVQPLGRNSHLFVSADEISHFPGRSFLIDTVSSMNRRELKRVLHGITRANISVRNFPLTAQQLRQRLRLADGGDVYIFGTTIGQDEHKLLICRKIG